MMTHDPAAHVTIWWGIVWYNYTAGLASGGGGGEGEGGEGGGDSQLHNTHLSGSDKKYNPPECD